jgi:hypothetical protein
MDKADAQRVYDEAVNIVLEPAVSDENVRAAICHVDALNDIALSQAIRRLAESCVVLHSDSPEDDCRVRATKPSLPQHKGAPSSTPFKLRDLTSRDHGKAFGVLSGCLPRSPATTRDAIGTSDQGPAMQARRSAPRSRFVLDDPTGIVFLDDAGAGNTVEKGRAPRQRRT